MWNSRHRQLFGLAFKGLFPGRRFLAAYYQDPQGGGRAHGARYAFEALVRGFRRLAR